MVKMYLDSSAITKRYVEEKESQSASLVYKRSDDRYLSICFSIWNIGEVVGAIDQYQKRGWITETQNIHALWSLASESLRLIEIEAP